MQYLMWQAQVIKLATWFLTSTKNIVVMLLVGAPRMRHGLTSLVKGYTGKMLGVA